MIVDDERGATRLPLTTMVAAVLMLASCGSDDRGDDPTGRPTTSAASASPVPATDAPTTEAPTDTPGAGAPVGGSADPVPGFPGTTASQKGRGSGPAGLVLDGDASLQIVASRTTAPAPDYYSGPQRVEARTGSLTEVYVAGTFEGYTGVFAGIDDAAVPFRVFTLSEPSRLVVDVRDASDD